MPNHLKLHVRFYLAALIGLGAWLVVPAAAGRLGLQADIALRLVLAGDAFFVTYLVGCGLLVAEITVDRIRARARDQDEGIVLIILLMVGIVALSFGSVFQMVGGKGGGGTLELVLAIASIIMGWTTLHLMMAFHYAHKFYAHHERGGLTFPGTDEPEIWDFIYHSFVIGMTAQVADVDIVSVKMRRRIIFHSVISFFYNTIILALAVNIAAGIAS